MGEKKEWKKKKKAYLKMIVDMPVKGFVSIEPKHNPAAINLRYFDSLSFSFIVLTINPKHVIEKVCKIQ